MPIPVGGHISHLYNNVTLLSMRSSIADHASNVNASVTHGKHSLAIAVVPCVAILPPGELKEVARGDCRLGQMFMLLDTAHRAGSC